MSTTPAYTGPFSGRLDRLDRIKTTANWVGAITATVALIITSTTTGWALWIALLGFITIAAVAVSLFATSALRFMALWGYTAHQVTWADPEPQAKPNAR